MSRPAAVTMLAATFATMAVTVATANGTLEQGDGHDRVTGFGVVKFDGRTAERWSRAYHREHRELLELRRHLHRRWRPSVNYAIRLASAVSGVPYSELTRVAWCESKHDPYASNGRYRGLFQLGWAPFGMSPFDPVANALSAALTVRRDGSWRQWECKP